MSGPLSPAALRTGAARAGRTCPHAIIGAMSTLVHRPAVAAAAAGNPAAAGSHRGVAAWLLVCCALVFVMVVVGGVTRLTHSGLSITEWQPIVGTLPPIGDADWESVFDKYRSTPEYRDVNHGMSLAEFKGIFWWEYFHRLLGRMIGVAFLVPFVVFVARGRIPAGYGWAFAGIFALGAVQGAWGWYMVQSGLVDDPRVSQFRLCAHLGLAFLIFAAMFRAALSLRFPPRAALPAAQTRAACGLARWLSLLVFLQVLSGGLVAGIRAGSAYNTFPLMNGSLVPPEFLAMAPAWRNFFYNMATVQFDHRAVAVAVAGVGIALWWKIARAGGVPARVCRAAHMMLAALALQWTLGVLTLVLVVPVPLAALHQAGALLLFTAALHLHHALR
jgi:cytochrome c oxidase assembly protein subunit 15